MYQEQKDSSNSTKQRHLNPQYQRDSRIRVSMIRGNKKQIISNHSLSVSKSKTQHSTTINTINRTGNSFFVGPRKDKIYTYTIDVQRQNDQEFIRKFKTYSRENSKVYRKLVMLRLPNFAQTQVFVVNRQLTGEEDQMMKMENHCISFPYAFRNTTFLVQQGLTDEPRPQILNSIDELNKIKEQVDLMCKHFEPQTMEVEEWDYQVDYKKIELDIFSLGELKYLEEEFKKEEYERNYLTMDKILMKNKFFQRFGQGIRIGIMEKTSMEIHEAQDIILRLGANSNNLYVILRGSCQQTLTMDIQLPEYEYLTVQSYYDGQDLSEINLLQLNNNKGYSTNKFVELVEDIKEHQIFKSLLKNERAKLITSQISCVEKSYLLRMDNDQFQRILKQSIEKDKEFKLSILSQIRFFQHTSAAQLLHLVAELGIQNYFQGDCVVKKGDSMNRVIIIASGEFEIVEEIRLQRETRNYYLDRKLKPFTYKRNADRNTRPEIQRDFADQSFDYNINSAGEQGYTKTQKCYQFCNKQRKENNQITYTHLHVLKVLKKCDVICGRSLLILYDNEYDKEDTSFAKLTVVVKSVQGSVFFLDEKRYQNLPESLQNQILAGLRSMKEYDDYQIDNIQQQITQWEKFKQNTYQQFLKEKRKQSYKLY